MDDRQIAIIVQKINAALRRLRPRLTEQEAAFVLMAAGDDAAVQVFGSAEAARMHYMAALRHAAAAGIADQVPPPEQRH